MNVPPHDFEIVAAGDSLLIVEFEERLDPAINRRAIQLAATIESASVAGVRDVIPTYRSVAIHFDPVRTDVDRLTVLLQRETVRTTGADEAPGAPIQVPVCYGGDFGPDLAAAAAGAEMSNEEFAAIHAHVTYRVYMLGFLPGFAYMGIVDSRIALPRRATPRLTVPKGSVAIAGRQTGIYPTESPGGWQLIGRTPQDVFSLSRHPPARFKAGDRVRFVPITRDEFDVFPRRDF